MGQPSCFNIKVIMHCRLLCDKAKEKCSFHSVPDLIQQVQSSHVGLLCVQELAGDLKQLLFICLLETEGAFFYGDLSNKHPIINGLVKCKRSDSNATESLLSQ